MRNLKIRLTKYYIGLDLNLTKSSDGVRKLDIQYPCAEFYSICKGSTSFTEGVNFIQIKNVKLHELSNDVYEDGEERPKKVGRKEKGYQRRWAKESQERVSCFTGVCKWI